MANALKKKTKYRFAFSATDTVLYLLLLFPVSTLFQVKIPGLNRVIFFFTFLTLIFALFSKMNTVRLLTLPLLIFLYVWASLHTDFPLYFLNDFFYFLFLVLYTLLFITKTTAVERFFKNNSKYVYGVIYLWCGIIGVSAFVPAFYPYGNYYFMPFGVNGFRSSPTAMFILSLILIAMVYYKNRRIFPLSVLPLYVIFTGSSRTYFLVGVLLFAIVFYVYCKGKTKFYIYSIPGAVVGYKAYTITSIAEKTTNSIDLSGSREDFWYKLTSGRSVFWQVDLDAFKAFDWGRRLFGNGFNFVYDLNYSSKYGYIWAHNDFINLLLNFGAVGTLLYTACMVALIVFVLFRNKCKIPVVIAALVILVWLSNAMLNMFYTYFCACTSFPILLMAMNYYYTEKNTLEAERQKQDDEMHRKALEARRKRGLKI